jgi:hypothetical protein
VISTKLIKLTISYSISSKLFGIYFAMNESTLRALDKNLESLIEDNNGTNYPGILFACICNEPYVAHTDEID